MKTQNVVSLAVDAEKLQRLNALFEALELELREMTVSLSPDERASLLKLGPRNRDFVEQTYTAAAQLPECLPRFLDMEEAQRDLQLHRTLLPLLVRAEQIRQRLDDTAVASGSDAYMAALVMYQSLRDYGREAGLSATIDALAARFARKTRRSAT